MLQTLEQAEPGLPRQLRQGLHAAEAICEILGLEGCDTAGGGASTVACRQPQEAQTQARRWVPLQQEPQALQYTPAPLQAPQTSAHLKAHAQLRSAAERETDG